MAEPVNLCREADLQFGEERQAQDWTRPLVYPQVGMPDLNSREHMIKQTGSLATKKQKRKRWGPTMHF